MVSVTPPTRTLPPWMYGSRVANAGFAEDASDQEMNTTLSPLIANGVTVAEVDILCNDHLVIVHFRLILRYIMFYLIGTL